jgi:hypothetical protein
VGESKEAREGAGGRRRETSDSISTIICQDIAARTHLQELIISRPIYIRPEPDLDHLDPLPLDLKGLCQVFRCKVRPQVQGKPSDGGDETEDVVHQVCVSRETGEGERFDETEETSFVVILFVAIVVVLLRLLIPAVLFPPQPLPHRSQLFRSPDPQMRKQVSLADGQLGKDLFEVERGVLELVGGYVEEERIDEFGWESVDRGERGHVVRR